VVSNLKVPDKGALARDSAADFEPDYERKADIAAVGAIAFHDVTVGNTTGANLDQNIIVACDRNRHFLKRESGRRPRLMQNCS
jgi:hypothetical protein